MEINDESAGVGNLVNIEGCKGVLAEIFPGDRVPSEISPCGRNDDGSYRNDDGSDRNDGRSDRNDDSIQD